MRLWLLPIFVLDLGIKLKSYWNGPLAICLNSWRGVKMDMTSKCAVVVILWLVLSSILNQWDTLFHLWSDCPILKFCMVQCFIIGASLSEPHTSVTAFVEVVCMYVCLRLYTVNFKWAHLNISWRLNVQDLRVVFVPSPLLHRWRATARAQRWREARGTKTMHAWQLLTMTDKGRLLTDSTNHAQ